jgi:AcrR family transcriptional regulator
VTARVHQKERTREAIVEAARALIGTGVAITMPAIAEAARVSEATAYRYFPDLPTLLREALAGTWPSADEVAARLAGIDDPADRVAHATELLLRHVHTYRGAVRAMISAAITRPEAGMRPGYRFGLIDLALGPLPGLDRKTRGQLERDLAVVMSAETLFSLTDLSGLPVDEAIASAMSTARTITRARLLSRRAR